MNFASMTKQLHELYNNAEAATDEYKKDAVCKIGCALCCTTVGNVDITTLEGMVIRNHVAALPRKHRLRMEKALSRNRRDKEKQSLLPCPFLAADKTCGIYPVRPFSCRRLYSVNICGDTGPTLHREAAALSKVAIRALQLLDDTGYSGHISHILRLLEKPRFRKLYLSGGFDPANIMDFGKAHGIVINRFMAAEKPGTQTDPSLTRPSKGI